MGPSPSNNGQICLEIVNSYVQDDVERAVVSEVHRTRFFALILLALAVLRLIHGSVLLVLPEQVLFDMHEVPDEGAVEERHAGTDLQVHFANIRL